MIPTASPCRTLASLLFAMVCAGLCSCATIHEGPTQAASEPDEPVVTSSTVIVETTPLPEKIETKKVVPGQSPLRHDQPDTPLYKP